MPFLKNRPYVEITTNFIPGSAFFLIRALDATRWQFHRTRLLLYYLGDVARVRNINVV